MYDINLIGQRIVPDQQKKVIFSVISFSALIYALTLMGVLFFSVANLRMIDVYASEVDRLQTDLAALYPGAPTHGELDAMVGRVRPELEEIGGLVDRRVGFTETWSAIAECVPENAWLTRVRVVEPQVAGHDSRGNGKRSIVIEGLVLTEGEGAGDEAVQALKSALEVNETLIAYITDVRFVETGVREIGGEKVLGFEITCPLR